MQKKGQITVFMIVGIIILIVTGIIFYFTSLAKPEPTNLLKMEELKSPIKTQVDYCLEKSTKDAAFRVGMQGGYYLAPPVSEHYLGAFIPYYYYEQDVHLPEIGEVEEQLSLGIKALLPSCLDDIAAYFEKEGVMLSYEINEVGVKLTDTRTIIEAHLPIKIRIKGVEEEEVLEVTNQEYITDQTSMTELTNFVIEIDFQYKKMYDWTKEVVQLQARDPEWFPLGSISDLAYARGYSFEIIGVETEVGEPEEYEGEQEIDYESYGDDRNKVLISIVDNELFDKPYYFTFGILYNLNYEEMFEEDYALEERMENVAMELSAE